MTDYNKNKQTLSLYFPEEIACVILQFKYEIECDEQREYMIERDFYNWLNYDLLLRNSYREDIFSSRYCEYYIRHFKELGLNSLTSPKDNLRRTKSLHNCFQSPWWKTTEKMSIPWKKIHKQLKMFHEDFIFIWRGGGREFDPEEILDRLSVYWRKPEFKEKIVLINKETFELLEQKYEEWINHMEPVLFTQRFQLIL